MSMCCFVCDKGLKMSDIYEGNYRKDENGNLRSVHKECMKEVKSDEKNQM